MADIETIRFAFIKIDTDEFAIPGNSFDPAIPVEMKIGLNFGFFRDEMILRVQTKCELYQQEKLVALVTVSCHFKIEKEDWGSVYSVANKTFTLSKFRAAHFAGLTVGVARGVLHSKTEKTPLNSFILPPINLPDFVQADIVVPEAGQPVQEA